jgi:2-C-methyl-D-erythritol 2,4-cyclodiphosphate synthase
MTKIGLGRDLHRLAAGRRFIVGGIVIPFDKGEEGHSDGDVLCHAIIDALLGAAGLGDIGELFPPHDARYKDADSIGLLKQVRGMLKERGVKIGNIDCVVSAEKPALLPHRDAIRENLARVLEIERSQIFVKGKTGEKIGLIGEELAVEALAVCLIEV